VKYEKHKEKLNELAFFPLQNGMWMGTQ